MWVIGSDNQNSDGYLFLSSNVIRNYISGNEISDKFNNIQIKIFGEEDGLNEAEFITKLRKWLLR